MNERSVAELFRDITGGLEPALGISARQGLTDGRRLRRRRRLIQTSITALAVVAVLAGSAALSDTLRAASDGQQVAKAPSTSTYADSRPANLPTTRALLLDWPPGRASSQPPAEKGCEAPPAVGHPTPALAKCLASAKAETTVVIAKLKAKYGATKSTVDTDKTMSSGGYPIFSGSLHFKDGSHSELTWYYVDRKADLRSSAVCQIEDTYPWKRIWFCETRVLPDGSYINIASFPTERNAVGPGQISVTRLRTDGLIAFATIIPLDSTPSARALTLNQLIEITGSPLLKG